MMERTDSHSDEEQYKEYLNSLNLWNLKDSIRTMLNSDLRSMEETEIKEGLLRILSVNNRITHNLFYNTLDERQLYFFRARGVYEIPEMKRFSWYWNNLSPDAPHNGRFDYLDVPLLYTALSPGGALNEKGVKENDPHVITCYTNHRKIQMITVFSEKCPFVNSKWDGNLSPEQREKAKIIIDFAETLLLWNDGDSSTSHKISRAASDFFFGENAVYDAILYRSVKDSNGLEYNVAFKDPTQCLEIYLAVEYYKIEHPLFGIDVSDGQVRMDWDVQGKCYYKSQILEKWLRKMGFVQANLDHFDYSHIINADVHNTNDADGASDDDLNRLV